MTQLNLKVLVTAIGFTFALSAFSQTTDPGKNYQFAFESPLGTVITGSNLNMIDYKNIERINSGRKEGDAQKPLIDPKSIRQDIDGQKGYATFYDLAYGSYGVHVVNPNGKTNRIMQARGLKKTDGKWENFSYENISLGQDGSVSNYTFCETAVKDPAKSDCFTVDAVSCAKLKEMNADEKKFSEDVKNCGKIVADVVELKKVIDRKELQAATDDNLKAMNESPVRNFIMGDSARMSAKIDDIPFATENTLQKLNSAVKMNSACARLRTKGLMAEVASTTAPTTQAPADSAQPAK